MLNISLFRQIECFSHRLEVGHLQSNTNTFLTQRINASLRLLRMRHREVHSLQLVSIPDTQRTQSAGFMVCSRALLGFRMSELSLFPGRF